MFYRTAASIGAISEDRDSGYPHARIGYQELTFPHFQSYHELQTEIEFQFIIIIDPRILL